MYLQVSPIKSAPYEFYRSFVSEENYFVIFPLHKLEFLLPKKHENYIINTESGTDIVKIIELVETYK